MAPGFPNGRPSKSAETEDYRKIKTRWQYKTRPETIKRSLRPQMCQRDVGSITSDDSYVTILKFPSRCAIVKKKWKCRFVVMKKIRFAIQKVISVFCLKFNTCEMEKKCVYLFAYSFWVNDFASMICIDCRNWVINMDERVYVSL